MRRHTFWSIAALALVVLSATGACTLRQNTSARWQIGDWGTTRPLSRAAWVVSETGAALVWQPADAPTALTYAPLNAPQQTVPLQPYAESTPTHWHIAPTSRGTLHVVWQEHDGRLRSALLTPDGATLRGPVELADYAEPDFALIALADGGAWALWRTASERIASLRLDADGRPQPVQRYAPPSANAISAKSGSA